MTQQERITALEAQNALLSARIKELDQRIQALIPRVATLTKEQQGEVQELAVAELQGQQERLVVYGTQARFAVAQIYDRALSQSNGKPTAPNAVADTPPGSTDRAK